MTKRFLLVSTLLCILPFVGNAANPTTRYRAWIEQMKEAPRGPFDSVQWYCKDGTELPPKPYACQPHGGGHQYGRWSTQTRELRQHGYYVGTLLAGIDAAGAPAAPDFVDQFHQLLIERYLMAVDDGWIFRRALFYRGAIQEEDERAGGRRLLLGLLSRPEWTGLGYPTLRMGVRSLPHGSDSASVQAVRQRSANLAERDPAFQRLRAKIHGSPDADDAARVRDYAAEVAAQGAHLSPKADSKLAKSYVHCCPTC